MLNLHSQFVRQAERTPEAVALVDQQSTLSYAELDRRSDALAATLNLLGVDLDDTVGIYLPKSTDYAVACLAAMKSGGAFLPLFLDSPPNQLGKILEQTETKAVISTVELSQRLPAPHTVKFVNLDAWEPPPAPWPEPPRVELDNLMFVVYTSGTTGEPKGIQLPHRAAAHSYAERYKISSYQPGQRVACNIFFVWEIFRVLSKGAAVHVVSDDIIYDPKLLADFLEHHQITEMLFTPSLMETMLNQWSEEVWQNRLTSLEVIWLNGEVVTEELRQKCLDAVLPQTRLLNTYSISECHDVASYDLRTARPSPTGFSAVGYPIDGIQVKLMENSELYVGGPGLARGYLGKPHLTAERFVTLEGERYYRTGDIGYFREDGLLEIRGRCDSMVKIRGYSVHLGAVQSVLEKLPSVKSAAVVAVGKEGRDKRLVAYVVGENDKNWSIDPGSHSCPELRDALRDSLPEFMLPNLFVELDSLPLSPTTGKLDTKLLPPLPARRSFPVDDLRLPAEANLQQLQTLIATLWERILGLDPGVVTPESNFFDLGGHSLMAVRVVNHLERLTGFSISVKDLYKYPTVKQLSQFIHSGDHSNASQSPGPQPEDWVLPEEISPEGAEWTGPDKASGILVTGATGFLGAFLVDRLLKASSCPIYCLVRGEQPQKRLEENLSSYGLTLSPRIRAISGDLSKSNLGMSIDDRNLLEAKVDLVFHCGAAVNYVHNYEVLKPHTVGGTLEILKFCAAGEKARTLHYISTNGVFPGGDTYPENREIDSYLEDLSNGYGHSKWVAEKLVWQAIERGLPTTIYRPGNVGHHSQSGARNSNDFQTLLVRACLCVGQVPQTEGWYFEMTPVDFLTNAIVTIASDSSRNESVFNIVQSPPTPAQSFFEAIRLPVVTREEWLENLTVWARNHDDSQLEVLARSLSDVEGYLRDTSVYRSEQFDSTLQAHGLSRPEAGLDYLQLLAAEPVGLSARVVS